MYTSIQNELTCVQKCTSANPVNGRKSFTLVFIQFCLAFQTFFLFPSTFSFPFFLSFFFYYYLANLGTQFQSGNCWCFTSQCLPATVGTGSFYRLQPQAWSVAMVGACSTYPFMSAQYSCQSVTYPTSGCITSNNIACGCAVNALTCNPATGVTQSWYVLFLNLAIVRSLILIYNLVLPLSSVTLDLIL